MNAEVNMVDDYVFANNIDTTKFISDRVAAPIGKMNLESDISLKACRVSVFYFILNLRIHVQLLEPIMIDDTSTIADSAVSTGSVDRIVKFWGLVNFELIDSVGSETTGVHCLSLNPDGKPYEQSAKSELPMLARLFHHYDGWANIIHGITLPGDGNYHIQTSHEPHPSVAGQTIPRNFPLILFAWEVGPALACDIIVFLRTAEQTPLTVLYAAESFLEVDYSPGVVNIVSGFGPTAGAALASHMDVDKLAFTGSTDIKKRLWAEAEVVFYARRDIATQKKDVAEYNVVIKAYGKAKLYNKVISFYRGMRNHGTWPDEFTYNFLVQILSAEDLVDKAVDLLTEMQDLVLITDTKLIFSKLRDKGQAEGVSFAAMMHFYKRMGLLDEVLYERSEQLDWVACLNFISRAAKQILGADADTAKQILGVEDFILVMEETARQIDADNVQVVEDGEMNFMEEMKFAQQVKQREVVSDFAKSKTRAEQRQHLVRRVHMKELKVVLYEHCLWFHLEDNVG